MSIAVLRDVDLVFDAYRLRGAMNSVALNDACDLEEAIAFGDTGKRRLAGLFSPGVNMEGYFESANDAVLQANLGVVDVPIMVAPEGNADGARAFFFRAAAGEYEFFGQVGKVNPFRVNALGSDGARLVRGTIMHNAARTATGQGTARQLGAVGATQKMYAALHVLSASASDTLDVTVASDDAQGFASGVTRLTFAQKTAIGSQFLSTPGAIADDWWRVEWTIGGVDPSFEFLVVLGIL